MHALKSKFLKKLGRTEDSQEFIAARERYKSMRDCYGSLASSGKAYMDQTGKSLHAFRGFSDVFKRFFEMEHDAAHQPWMTYDQVTQLLNNMVFLHEGLLSRLDEHFIGPTRDFVDRTQRAHALKARYAKLQVDQDSAAQKLHALQKKNAPGMGEAEDNLRQVGEACQDASRQFVDEVVELEAEHCAETVTFAFFQDLLELYRESTVALQRTLDEISRTSGDHITHVSGDAMQRSAVQVEGTAAGADSLDDAMVNKLARSLTGAGDSGNAVSNREQAEVVPVTQVNEEFRDEHNRKETESSFVVVALHAYEAQEDNELSFVVGDEILVTQTTFDGQISEWWEGQCGDRLGFFPANYVRRMVQE